jgi:hypothetical protein
MNFTPKTQREIDEDNLLPVGEADFEVMDATDKQSKSGNDMIELKVKIWATGGGEGFVWDYLLEKMAYKLRHFCYATGLGDKYDSGTITAPDCVGKAGKCMLKVEKQTGYSNKNSIADYIVGDPVAAAIAGKPKPADNTSIPF